MNYRIINRRISGLIISALSLVSFTTASAQTLVEFTTANNSDLAVNMQWNVNINNASSTEVSSVAINDDVIYFPINNDVDELDGYITLGRYDISNGEELDNILLKIEGVSVAEMKENGGCNGQFYICSDDAGNLVVTFDSSYKPRYSDVATFTLPWYYGIVNLVDNVVTIIKNDVPVTYFYGYNLIGWGQPAVKGDITSEDFCIGAFACLKHTTDVYHQAALLISSGKYALNVEGNDSGDKFLISYAPISSSRTSISVNNMYSLGKRCTFTFATEGGDGIICNGTATYPMMIQMEYNLMFVLSTYKDSHIIDTNTKGYLNFNHDSDKFALMTKSINNGGEWVLAEWTSDITYAASQIDWSNDSYKTWMHQMNYHAVLTENGVESAEELSKKSTLNTILSTSEYDDEPIHVAAHQSMEINEKPVTDIVLYTPGKRIAKYRIGAKDVVSTVVNQFEDNEEETPIYYTLQGIRIDGCPTSPGIYISKSSQKVTKTVIR